MNECTLLEKAKQGEPGAFDALVRPHQERLYKLALVLSRSHEDAEDILQDTLIRAYKSLQAFRGECAFATWLTRILLNVTRNKLRSEQRLHLRLRLMWMSALGKSNDPGERLDRHERREFLRRALVGLPSHYREPLVMFHYQNMSYQEIADVLQVPVGTVRSRLAKGRRLLQRALLALGYPVEND
ncbi:MAG: sigma-70 family RNA polymerase sigma factor [Armatimonadota bacterium]|nr:sigma-70 family RNA polymerase sigma factor [Armatimonadota bacterium]